MHMLRIYIIAGYPKNGPLPKVNILQFSHKYTEFGKGIGLKTFNHPSYKHNLILVTTDNTYFLDF